MLSFCVHTKPKVRAQCFWQEMMLLFGFVSGDGCIPQVCSFYSPGFFFPQVRKAAQYGVCSVLRGSEFMFGDAAPEHHPAAPSTAKFCVQEIEKAGGVGHWSMGSVAECGGLCHGETIRTWRKEGRL